MYDRGSIATLFACAALLGCAGGDSVAKDRFGHTEDGDADDGGDTSGGDSSGDPSGAATTGGGSEGATTGGGPSGTSGSSSGGTSGGSSSGSTCDDTGPGESNDTEAEATDVGTIDDCDTSGGYLEAVLAGEDVDWYVYHGDDALGCVVDAWRDLTADGGFRMCKFFDCGGNPIAVTCPENASPETSPDGRGGCCAQEAFEVAPDCPGWTDSANVYIRIDKPPAYDCVHYKLTLHY